ncbi:MAG: Stp1/IreP family PP2C-type Ser/Thr phosphatase [Clostridia bacterium]|nr:Stp1/IreP family PP2C-type Ser/Thr phosphatase [Clostridia bacterium]
MKFAGKTETGLRPQNEDNYLILRTDAISAVAVSDGMGGHQAGEVASHLAVQTLETVLAEPHPSAEAALSEAFSEANRAVHTRASLQDEMYGMGCTLVAAIVDETQFAAANIGDSRLYHFNGETLHPVTHDHSFVAELVRRGAITPAEAKTHPRRNLITRAVGTEARVKADIFSCEWKKNDMLLLCSDGLCGVLEDAEMAAFLRNCTDLEATCATLIERALAAGSRDNITVVLVKNDGGDA